MLKRALALLGLGGAIALPGVLAAPDPALYERLFCDRPALYRPASAAEATPWQALLFDAAADPAALRALAEDPRADSRVRTLAWGRLREQRQPVPTGELLGVVFEVEVNGGLDVLAAYADGRLRYLNHGGRVAVFGEAAMFTAQLAGPNAAPMGMNAPIAGQNARFALHVMRWLAGTGPAPK